MFDIDAAEALCAAATPGPWHYSLRRWSHTFGYSLNTIEGGDYSDKYGPQSPQIAEMPPSSLNDARFIAAARTLLPEALAELMALRKVVWRLNGGSAGASDEETANLARVEIERLAAWEGRG